jgi:hypothetical protein
MSLLDFAFAGGAERDGTRPWMLRSEGGKAGMQKWHNALCAFPSSSDESPLACNSIASTIEGLAG